MKTLDRFTILACVLLLLSGCAASPDTLRDIRSLPQDLTFYLPAAGADHELVSSLYQKEADDRFNAVFFAPWHRLKPLHSKEELLEKVEKFRGNPGYGENKRKHSARWIEDLAYDADLDSYPDVCFPAVTVAGSDLRELPTARPHFNSFEEAGEGYPFDNLQYSAIAPGTPVLITHLSRDREWALAESHNGVGWLRQRDFARVDEEFVRVWETAPLVAVVRDGLPVVDGSGVFRFQCSIGSIFPLIEEDGEGYEVWVAAADENGQARPRKARLPKEGAVRKPWKLTRTHIAALANEMMGEPYGWGGMYQNRDCSALTRDLFAPFGLWLPRNSKEQAKEGASFRDLHDLPPEARERIINEKGVPFLTSIWLKGHIALYLGSRNRDALVFHTFWGIKTKDLLGRKGRKVVGHAAVTTLHPGIELPDIDLPEGDLLDRVQGIVFLVPPDQVL